MEQEKSVAERSVIDGCEAADIHVDIPITGMTVEGGPGSEASAAVIRPLSAMASPSDHSTISCFDVSPARGHCCSAPVSDHMNARLIPFDSKILALDLTSPAHSSAVPSWLSLVSSGGGPATANSGVSFCISRCSLQSPAMSTKRPTDSNAKSAAVRPEPCRARDAVAFTPTQQKTTTQVAETRSGIALTFEDVSYSLAKKRRGQCPRLCSGPAGGSKGQVKQILNGISGYARPGEMLALMGPSGSGKTTLLNLLGGRMTVGAEVRGMRQGGRLSKKGTILYDGAPYNKFLKSRMGFVTQDDVLYPHLTVRETLTYAALLRLPSSMSSHRKSEIADDVIRRLGLEGCADTIIGTAFLRGVSGGERKRVCIGHEILIDPSLLFLDEPTSGLDSTTALRIVSLLKGLAQAGRSVIATIHQPSSRAFHLFDRLLLLAEGHSLYFGEAHKAVQYFEARGFVSVAPVNPADYLLDLCSGNTSDVSVPLDLMERAGDIEDPSFPVFKRRVLQFMLERKQKDGSAALDKAEAMDIFERKNAVSGVSAQEAGRVWAVGWVAQVRILLERGFKERRHDFLGWLKVTQVMATALLCGALWWRSSNASLAQTEDQVGLLFFVALFWGFFPLFNAIFAFPLERAMLTKERSSDMYRLSAYFIARSISDVPLDLLLPTGFLIVIYVMATLRASLMSFLYTLFSVYLTVITAQGVGLLIGAALMDVKNATTFAAVFVIGLMLVAGFFVQHVPKLVAWIKYLSLQSYCYKLLLKIQYPFYHSIGICSGNADASAECAKALSLTRALHGMKLDPGLDEVWALLALSLLSRLLAYLALRRLKISSSFSTKKFRHCACFKC